MRRSGEERIAVDAASWGVRRGHGLALLLLAALCSAASVLLAGCSDPDREILATLDARDRSRFENGRRLAVPCWTCHDLKGTVRKVGPSLRGVFGRASGRAPDYEASPAMVAASIVWDEARLSAFLANPAGFVPGNRMVSPGIPNASARADLLFYLEHVSRPAAPRP